MIKRWRGRGAALVVGAALALGLVATTGAAAVPAQVAPPAGQGTPVTACANPVVDRDLGGWGRHAGGTSVPARVPVAAHQVASFGAWLNGNGANPAFFLPQKTVKPGQVWTLGLDSWVDRGGANPTVRMDVDWFTASGTYLSSTDGTPRPVPSGPAEAWTRSASDFTVPANAARMNPKAVLFAPANASWIATACDLRPSYLTTPPPTTVPPTTTPAPPATTTPAPTTVPPTTGNPPAGTIEMTGVPRSGAVLINWTTSRTDITGWKVERDGIDASGTGPWSTEKAAADRSHDFTNLVNGTSYTFTLTPHTAGGDLAPITVTGTPTDGGSTPPTTTPPAGGDTAAATQGWGAPAWSLEFNDLSGLGLYNSPGHEHGDRSPAQCVVVNGVLELRSLPNRATCGVADNLHRNIEYGRYETRTRTTGSGWMALHIIWPSSEAWPRDGERDWLEFPAGSSCYTGFIHYPDHTPQRQYQIPNGCPAGGTSTFHNVAVEFAPSTIRGFIDGANWYTKSCDADLCQMPGGGHLTIQNDATVGTPGTATTYVDHVRYYPLS
jgi:hypothetical protein